MALSPAERKLRAQLAANLRWAHADREEESRKASRRQLRSFEDQVDPDRELPPAERAARAENARKAHMAALSLKAAKARRLRAEAARLDAEAVS